MSDKMIPASAFREKIKSVKYRDIPKLTGEYALTPESFNALVKTVEGWVEKKLSQLKTALPVYTPGELESAVTSALWFHDPYITIYADPDTGHGRMLECGYQYILRDTAAEILISAPQKPNVLGWDKV